MTVFVYRDLKWSDTHRKEKHIFMELKQINTNGITSLTFLERSECWYWGSDYTYGDLYEAQELYNEGHRITKNRLIFVNGRSAEVREPVIAEDGQYFGQPVYAPGEFIILLVDFRRGQIRILACDESFEEVYEKTNIPLGRVKDCYNLMLKEYPLMLTRSEAGLFQIVWPFEKDFVIGDTEAFCFRDEDRLYFSRWYEDPDYREETVIRSLSTSEITEVIAGSHRTMEDGQQWILK